MSKQDVKEVFLYSISGVAITAGVITLGVCGAILIQL